MYYLCTGQVFMNLSWLIAKWTNCSFHVCMTSYNIVIYHHLLHFNMFVLFDLCRLLRLVWMWNEELHCCRGLGSSSCEVKDRGWASFRSSLGISDSVEFSACVFGHASAGLCRCERLKSTNTHTHTHTHAKVWHLVKTLCSVGMLISSSFNQNAGLLRRNMPNLIMSWIWVLPSESRLSQVSSVDNECKLLKKVEDGEENRRIEHVRCGSLPVLNN